MSAISATSLTVNRLSFSNIVATVLTLMSFDDVDDRPRMGINSVVVFLLKSRKFLCILVSSPGKSDDC